MSKYPFNPDKGTTVGLLGDNNSLAYRVHEIEKHIHGVQYAYGWNHATYATGTDIERHSTNPLELTAGDAAWGTELQIHGGSVLPGVKFDFNKLVIIEVGTANRPFVVQLYCGTQATGVACTFDFTAGTVEDMIVSAGHGLSNGDKIQFSGTLPAELSPLTVYYVVNKDTDYFQVSLTLGGAAVEFTDDGGAGFIHELTQSEAFDNIVSSAAVNADAQPYEVMMPRCNSTDRLYIRAKSAAGGNSMKYFLEGHSYTG